MEAITVLTPAKINLALDIVGTDEKGYHLMEMVLQTINLFDTVSLRKTDKNGIHLSCNIPYIPCNEKNIAHKCAVAFFEFCGISTYGIEINLDKIIPSQAGMAGGSANGAGVLVGLNTLFDTKLTLSGLCEISAKIGADIPFCIMGGTAKVLGIGEKITKIKDLPLCSILIVKPPIGINTKRAFHAFDEANIPPKLDLSKFCKAIETQNLQEISQHMYNAFEEVTDLSDVLLIKNILCKNGALNALMTGSGSAVFGIFTDAKKALACQNLLKKSFRETFFCQPCSHGAKII